MHIYKRVNIYIHAYKHQTYIHHIYVYTKTHRYNINRYAFKQTNIHAYISCCSWIPYPKYIYREVSKIVITALSPLGQPISPGGGRTLPTLARGMGADDLVIFCFKGSFTPRFDFALEFCKVRTYFTNLGRWKALSSNNLDLSCISIHSCICWHGSPMPITMLVSVCSTRWRFSGLFWPSGTWHSKRTFKENSNSQYEQKSYFTFTKLFLNIVTNLRILDLSRNDISWLDGSIFRAVSHSMETFTLAEITSRLMICQKTFLSSWKGWRFFKFTTIDGKILHMETFFHAQ